MPVCIFSEHESEVQQDENQNITFHNTIQASVLLFSLVYVLFPPQPSTLSLLLKLHVLFPDPICYFSLVWQLSEKVSFSNNLPSYFRIGCLVWIKSPTSTLPECCNDMGVYPVTTKMREIQLLLLLLLLLLHVLKIWFVRLSCFWSTSWYEVRSPHFFPNRLTFHLSSYEQQMVV